MSLSKFNRSRSYTIYAIYIRFFLSQLKLAKVIQTLLNDPKKVCRICGFLHIAAPLTTLMPAEEEVLNEEKMKNENEKSSNTKKPIEDDKICVIIEDVMTSGSYILEGIECLKKENPNEVIEVYVIIDREQGGKENLENHGIKVKSLFTITQFMRYLLEAEKITPEIVKDVNDYVAANQTSNISV